MKVQYRIEVLMQDELLEALEEEAAILGLSCEDVVRLACFMWYSMRKEQREREKKRGIR